MVYCDCQGVFITADEWIRMGLDKGLSPEDMFRALKAQMAGKSRNAGQEGASLAFSDLATARHNWFQNWYRKLGFNVSVPLPPISDEEFNRRKALGQALFYRPSTLEVSYDALMSAVGQGKHWTVTGEGDSKQIVWEPTQTGYWFWTEVAQDCPRLKTPWNTLVKEQKLNLLSLEEDVIVWWTHRAGTSTLLDTRTWSWLRTRFGQGALHASGYGGRVGVCRYWFAGNLSRPYDVVGGRAAEVVKM